MAGKDDGAPASAVARRKLRRRGRGHVDTDPLTDPGLAAFVAAGVQGGLGAIASASQEERRGPGDVRIDRHMDPGLAGFATTGMQGGLGAGAAGAQQEVSTQTNLRAAAISTVPMVLPEEPDTKFLDNFYATLNSTPEDLHLFYDEDAKLVWKFNGPEGHLRTVKEMKTYLSELTKSNKTLKFDWELFDSQATKQNSVFLMVNGTFKAMDGKISTFVQSFLLLKEHPKVLVSNDFLIILENAIPQSVKKLTDYDLENTKLCLEHTGKSNCSDTSKEELPQSIPVSCNGREGLYSLEKKLISCLCQSCNGSSFVMTPSMWDKHAASKSKKWKTSIKIKDTETSLNNFIENLKPSTRSKKQQVFPAAMLKNKDPENTPVIQENTGKSNSSDTSKEELPHSIPVSCNGREGLFSPEKQSILCLCNRCNKSASVMTLSEWDKHAGSRRKNWKISIKLKDSEMPLNNFIENLKPPTTSKKQQDPRNFRVCILEDCDGMMSHKSKDKHEEAPERVQEIMKKLREDGVLDRVYNQTFCSANRRVVQGVHDKAYMAFIDALPMTLRAQLSKFPDFAGVSLFSSPGTRRAVSLAAGAFIKGCEVVVEGKFDKAFAIIRPPGHHAHRRKAEGFCYLNNVAIGAQHLLTNYGKSRILLVDFDVHHGNGTQDIFYGSKQVLFVSTHRKDIYPDSDKEETYLGDGVGEGYNINIPLKIGFGDKDLIYVFQELLVPVAKEFCPEIVLVSAGYDAADGDTLGECKVSPKGFGTLVHQLLCLADGKIVLGLEGGYNLKQLSMGVSHTIRSLLGDTDAFYQDQDIPNIVPDVMETTIEMVDAKPWQGQEDSPVSTWSTSACLSSAPVVGNEAPASKVLARQSLRSGFTASAFRRAGGARSRRRHGCVRSSQAHNIRVAAEACRLRERCMDPP